MTFLDKDTVLEGRTSMPDFTDCTEQLLQVLGWRGAQRQTQVGAAADEDKDGVLVVQQGRLPGRDPHVSAAGRVGALKQLLELCGIVCPLRRVDVPRVVLPRILQAVCTSAPSAQRAVWQEAR